MFMHVCMLENDHKSGLCNIQIIMFLKSSAIHAVDSNNRFSRNRCTVH